MEPSGVARVVGFMAAHAREGFASVEEAAEVISDYPPHRPSRKASPGLAHSLRRKDDGRFYCPWAPTFIEAVTRPGGVSTANGRSARSATTARSAMTVQMTPR